MTEAIEFFSTRVLRCLQEGGEQRSGEIADKLQADMKAVQTALQKLKQQGCVTMRKLPKVRQKYYTFVKWQNLGDREPVHYNSGWKRPKPRTGPRTKSGTGIIVRPMQPQPFKPLVRRDFLERMELAEMTR